MFHRRTGLIILLIYIFTLSSVKSEEGKSFLPTKQEKPFTGVTRHFFVFNSDLRRIGYEEFTNIAYPYSAGGVYRMSIDYRLGLGDTVLVVFSGKLQESYKLTIDQDGKIMLPLLDEIHLLGLTLEQAKNTIQNEVDKRYANVRVGFNLAAVQEIRISVLGNAKNPGIYLVSPFSRLVEGIAKAGGPRPEGTLINMKLLRNNREIVKFNVYDYLFSAHESSNLPLKDDDTIFIPEIKNLCALRGEVMKPGIYEFESGTKLSEIIKTAKGLISKKIGRKILVTRLDPSSGAFKRIKEIKVLPTGIFENNEDIVLENEDTIFVTTESENIVYPEEIERIAVIKGMVNKPGEYLVEKGEKLSSLLKRAGGLREGAYLEGVVFTRLSVAQEERRILEERIKMTQSIITREQTELSEAALPIEEKAILQKKIDEKKKLLDVLRSKSPTGRIIIDLQKILNGEDDIVLEKGEVIYIPEKPGWVLVSGEVQNNIAVKFSPDKDINYYLNQVGGITKDGDEESIYVIKVNGKVESKDTGYSKILPGDIIVVPEKETRVNKILGTGK